MENGKCYHLLHKNWKTWKFFAKRNEILKDGIILKQTFYSQTGNRSNFRRLR